MQELVKVNEHQIGQKKQLGVDARELWEFLGVKTPFDKWIRRRISEAGFVEGKDFIIFDKVVENSGRGRPQKEYIFSLGSSKEVAMLERNNKGREVRQYFIDCEEKYLNSTPPTTKEVAVSMQGGSLVQQAEMFLAIAKQQEALAFQVQETRQIAEEALEATKKDQGYITALGYARKNKIFLQDGALASIGKKLSTYCRKNKISYEKISDSRWGTLNVYPEEVLQKNAYLFLEFKK